MNITPSMVIDIILMIFVCAHLIRGYKEGFMTSAVRLVGMLGSIFGGRWVSRNYSDRVFANYIRSPLTERTFNYISQVAGSIDINSAVSGVLGNIPSEYIQMLLDNTGLNTPSQITPDMDSAVMLVDTVLAPVVTAVISLALFLLTYVIIKLLCNVVAWLFKGINSVPVLGFFNRIAGLFVGAANGTINIIILSLLLSIIVIATGDKIPFINSRVWNDSKILSITSTINPFFNI